AAFRKIERLCLVRERASEQLRQRLARGGFEAEAVEAALDRALACGLVDDGRFADVLVRSRLAQGRGRRGIAAELESLGIDADSVEALAAADDDAGEVDRALALLDRKPPRAKNRRDAAYRRLAQKGFSASVSSSAARLWCEANPVEG
ncbi:MAG: regulatory protein RecX, partial [Eggerthella lenta]